MRINHLKNLIKLNVIIFGLPIIGCIGTNAQDIRKNKYLVIQSSRIDTVSKILLANTATNSHYNVTYAVDRKKKVFDTLVYELPITYEISEKNKHFIKLVDIKNIIFENKQYKVYKYLLDNPNMADEEELYFYTPEIGIIIMESGSWFGYERLIETDDMKKTVLGFYLSEKIILDKHFFSSWRK